MQIVIDIPDEQIKKSLKESEYVLEDEGIKGFVNIAMLYTNGRLEFVDIERREDFYSCNFTPLPKGHGRIADMDEAIKCIKEVEGEDAVWAIGLIEWACGKRIIIESDKEQEE